jgi:hypothetical protein
MECPTPTCKGALALVKTMPTTYREEFYKDQYVGLAKLKAYECKECYAELYYAHANHPEYPRLVPAKQYNSASMIAGNDWVGNTCGEYTKRISRGVNQHFPLNPKPD